MVHHKNRIGKKIAICVLLSVIPVLVMAGFYLTHLTRTRIEEAYQANAQSISACVAQSMEKEKQKLLHYLEFWTANSSFQSAFEGASSFGDPAGLQERSKQVRDSLKLDALTVVDKAGKVLAAVPSEAGQNKAFQTRSTAAMSGAKPVADLEHSDQGFWLVGAAPVQLDKALAGAVTFGMHIDVPYLDQVNKMTRADMVLLRKNAVAVANKPELKAFQPDSQILEKLASSKTTQYALTQTGGKPYMVAYCPLASAAGADDAVMVVLLDATNYQAALRDSARSWAAGIGLIIALVLAVTFWLSRSIGGTITDVVSQLTNGLAQTTQTSGLVASASQALAEGASRQAAALEETSASLVEMSSMTQRNTASAEKARDLAAQARRAGDAGSTDMQAMSTAMADIKSASDSIGKIIKTIDEIAFQTNILALNAAVEAARAGEAGLGFAVVADEVRNLAQRAAQAARETAAKIEDSVRKSEHGVQISMKVGKSLDEIVTKAREVDELVTAVTAASKEQSQGIEQLNSAVTQMDQVTQSNAAHAEETASAASEMNLQAEAMKKAVADLLKLVGGESATEPLPNTRPEAGVAPQKPTAPAPAKTFAQSTGNGTARHSLPKSVQAPLPASPSSNGIKIPMDEGEFTRF